MKWTAAILRAAWHLRRAHPVVAFWRVVGFVHLMTLWLFAKKNPHLGARRMGVCRECVFYFEPHLTCGRAGEYDLDPNTQYYEPRGCWCYLPAATKIPRKDCWARSVGLDIGWPQELRPPR